MDDLAIEYRGRIKVVRFMAMGRFGDIPSPEMREQYAQFLPTVVLFDKGVEVDRWRLVIMEDVYRYDLNKFLASRRPRTPAWGALPWGK
jgi:hypothetical protein